MEEKKFNLAVIKLKHRALICYENVKQQRAREGKRKIATFKLRAMMQKRFVPSTYRHLCANHTNLKQGDLPITDYIQRFEQVTIQTELNEEVEHTIARFINGLNTPIAEKLELQQAWLFEDACKMALRVERQLKSRKAVPRPFTTPNPTLRPKVELDASTKGKREGESTTTHKKRRQSKVLQMPWVWAFPIGVPKQEGLYNPRG